MEKYIALLRGINIGGRNKIPMPQLKELFQELGFFEVVTYINSGNVVFNCENQDVNELIKICEAAIVEQFALNIPVAIIPAKELAEVMKHAPEWWDQDKDSIHYTIFVLPSVSVAEVYEAVGEIKPEYEQVTHHGRVIFWSAPAKTFSKARWSKIASSAVNNHVTIRNANTANKLLLLSQ